jgi:hypothetical protein
LEIEYDITREDLAAFQWHAVFESPRGRRLRRLSYLGWVLVVLLFALVTFIGADGFRVTPLSLMFFAVPLLIMLFLQWCLERWVLRRVIRHLMKDERPDRGQLGRHRVIVGEDGLSESTAVSESRTTWAGVDRVEQGADYIYIYVSPASAHVIPKRAFKDAAEAAAFYEFSQARKAAAG